MADSSSGATGNSRSLEAYKMNKKQMQKAHWNKVLGLHHSIESPEPSNHQQLSISTREMRFIQVFLSHHPTSFFSRSYNIAIIASCSILILHVRNSNAKSCFLGTIDARMVLDCTNKINSQSIGSALNASTYTDYQLICHMLPRHNVLQGVTDVKARRPSSSG
ncbi:unnamed protein product [Periconia digitata]|uniref:Uncharacterized protein n=1 Tax=Periconia digitata TaxID=1303443 RepID=A0A9W4UVB0_9PLEO|nr:unnamed protein product [Periconia digitata]